MPSLTEAGKAAIQSILNNFTRDMPGAAFALGTGEETLFTTVAGKVDILAGKDGERLQEDTIMWFASTTKLLTSVAALQLIDRGILTLGIPASRYIPELSTPLQLLDSIDPSTGEPKFTTTNEEITVLSLMNQTSGFGSEPGELVSGWKAWSKVGTGFVNSCKRENLIHTPPVNPAGATYEYGNGAEWLGLLIEAVTQQPLETYMQENIFRPLNMHSTSFIPFSGHPTDPSLHKRLMPLRWLIPNSSPPQFEPLTTQCPLLTLPRLASEIEVPAGGGGIYSTCHDYLLLLQHLLFHYSRPHSASSTSPPSSLLSPSSISSLYTGTLLPSSPALSALHAMLQNKFGPEAKVGDIDWTTGMCLWSEEAGQLQGWGRHGGSVGWMGAPGIEYWIDPKVGIACVLGTNLLPFAAPEVEKLKTDLERAVYANLVLD